MSDIDDYISEQMANNAGFEDEEPLAPNEPALAPKGSVEERLRSHTPLVNAVCGGTTSRLLVEAADELARLRAEVEDWRKCAVENVIPLEALIASDEVCDPRVKSLSPFMTDHVKERIATTRAKLSQEDK